MGLVRGMRRRPLRGPLRMRARAAQDHGRQPRIIVSSRSRSSRIVKQRGPARARRSGRASSRRSSTTRRSESRASSIASCRTGSTAASSTSSRCSPWSSTRDLAAPRLQGAARGRRARAGNRARVPRDRAPRRGARRRVAVPRRGAPDAPDAPGASRSSPTCGASGSTRRARPVTAALVMRPRDGAAPGPGRGACPARAARPRRRAEARGPGLRRARPAARRRRATSRSGCRASCSSPLYLTSEYVIRRPLGALLVGRRALQPAHASLYDFFAFGPDHKAGFAPIAFVDFGFNPSVGVYAFWDDAFVKGNDLSVHGSTWGADWLAGSLTERIHLARQGHPAPSTVTGVHRPDQRLLRPRPEHAAVQPEPLRRGPRRRERRARRAPLARERAQTTVGVSAP